MSLTNDMLKLKETADKIAAVRAWDIAAPVSIGKKMNDSYYEKRTLKSNDIKHVLQEYDVRSPMELKAALTAMWDEMKKEEMQAFIPVSMVAVAKNRPELGKQKVEQNVSAYVYEF